MPDTSVAPPPKQGGNGAFIGVAALMLLAMGGLLYWKFLGKSEPTPEAPPPPPVAAKPPEPEIEVPPPPPIEEVKEQEKSLVTAKKRPSGAAVGSCGPTCSGAVVPALQSTLRAVAGQARGCYERALRQNSTLQGKLMVSVRVSSVGTACSANLVNDSLGDPSVSTCVLQKFRGATYPKPGGGCADVQVPISFMPKTK